MKRCIYFNHINGHFIKTHSKNPDRPQWNKIVNDTIHTLGWVIKHAPNTLSASELESLALLPNIFWTNSPPYNLYISFLESKGVDDDYLLTGQDHSLAHKLKKMSQFEQWCVLKRFTSPLMIEIEDYRGMNRNITFSEESESFIKRYSKTPNRPQWHSVAHRAIYTFIWVTKHAPFPLSGQEVDLMRDVIHKNSPPYNLHAAFLEACNVESEKYLSGPTFELAKKLKNMSQFEQWAVLARLKSPLS